MILGSSWHSNKGACTHAQECAESPVYDLGSLGSKGRIADPENGIRFVRGSRNSDQEADDPDLVGYGFHRILHKGRELDMYM